MHEQAISSVRTTALRSVIAMQQESRFVDRDEDDGSNRQVFKWVAACCGEDECSTSFKEKRKKFVSYVSEDACAKHMINHLHAGWTHRKYNTWQKAKDCVNEFIALNPEAIEEGVETFEERESYRSEMEAWWADMPVTGAPTGATGSADGDGPDDIDGEAAALSPAPPSYPPPVKGKGKGKGKVSKGKGKGKPGQLDHHATKAEMAAAKALMDATSANMQRNCDPHHDNIEVRGQWVTLPMNLVQSICDSVIRVRNSSIQLNLLAQGLMSQSEHERRVLETSTSHLVEFMQRADYNPQASEEYQPH
jgi:hypothetical protein